MPADPLRELAALERELRRAQARPAVWDAVVRGEEDASVAARAQAGETAPAQLAVDDALFRPLPAAQRERLIGQMFAKAERPSVVVPRRQTRRNAAIAVGLAAAAVMLVVTRAGPPEDDTVVAWPSLVAFSVEVVGGLPGDRGDPPPVPAGVRNLAADREFRLQVRIDARRFALHRVVAHCGPYTADLPFTPISTDLGFVEVEVRPPVRAEEACEIEVQVREDSQVYRLPRSPDGRVAFISSPP